MAATDTITQQRLVGSRDFSFGGDEAPPDSDLSRRRYDLRALTTGASDSTASISNLKDYSLWLACCGTCPELTLSVIGNGQPRSLRRRLGTIRQWGGGADVDTVRLRRCSFLYHCAHYGAAFAAAFCCQQGDSCQSVVCVWVEGKAVCHFGFGAWTRCNPLIIILSLSF